MRTASAKASQVAKSGRMIFSFRPTLLKWRVNEPLLDLVRLRRGVIARTGKLQSKQPDVTGHKIRARGFCESKNRLIQTIQLLVTLSASIRNRCQFIYRPDTQKVSRHNPSAQPRRPAALRNPSSLHHQNLYAPAARPAIHFFADADACVYPCREGAGKGGADTAPPQEIGDVIFTDCFRQIFVSFRAQAFPFFQRRAIRQRNGILYASPFLFPAIRNN